MTRTDVFFKISFKKRVFSGRQFHLVNLLFYFLAFFAATFQFRQKKSNIIFTATKRAKYFHPKLDEIKNIRREGGGTRLFFLARAQLEPINLDPRLKSAWANFELTLGYTSSLDSSFRWCRLFLGLLPGLEKMKLNANESRRGQGRFNNLYFSNYWGRDWITRPRDDAEAETSWSHFSWRSEFPVRVFSQLFTLHKN